MKRLMLAMVMLLAVSSPAWAAAITSAQSGNWSAPTTWVGGVKPGVGDTAIIATAHTVTVDENTTIGNKGSAVGHAIAINATNSTTFGKLIVSSGVILTLRGFDTITNTCCNINTYGIFNALAGSTVLIDVVTDGQSHILNNGRFIANGAVLDIPSANITWSNASGTRTKVAVSPFVFNKITAIAIQKADTATTMSPGPISNLAGTGIGSFGNTSFHIISSTRGPVDSQEVATYAAMANNGDYYVDYQNGIYYYKNTVAGALSISYSYKYGSWATGGVTSLANVAGSSCNIQNSTINHWGAVSTTENIGAAIQTGYRASNNVDREIVVQNNVFSYCGKTLAIYNLISDSTHYLSISGNSFNYSRSATNATGDNNSNFDAVFQQGYGGYIDYNNNTFNTWDRLFHNGGRSGTGIVYLRNNSGRILTQRMANNGMLPFYFEDNTFTGFGATIDAAGFDVIGTATGSIYYRRNKMSSGHRAARMNNYMVVQNNTFDNYMHHTVVHAPATAYITGYDFSGNTFYNSDNDLSGGWTLGYNATMWVDNVSIYNNTFDSSLRSLRFNDLETPSRVLGTRIKIYNNDISNNQEGIYLPTNDANNVSKLALSRLDYNNEYNHKSVATNIFQGSPMLAGLEYNLNSRNVTGSYLFSPNYAMPDATSRSLVQVNSGSAPTNLSMTLTWSGGAAKEMILAQGTATGGTTSTLLGSGWTVDQFVCRYVKIISGAGTGQIGMVKSNTATTLNIIAPVVGGLWMTAPDATSVYAIIESDTVLLDSGGTQSIHCGLYLPEVNFTTSTLTDSGITWATNAKFVDPQYTSAYAPQNAALKTAGFGGVGIGAAAVLAANVVAKKKKSNFGFGGFRF